MAKRRSNHEGTIRQRDNGTYRAQVAINGQRLSYTGKTKAECQAWIRNTLIKYDKGYSLEATKRTYSDFIQSWLAIKKSTVKPATYRQYAQLAKDYIVPALGKIKLGDVRPDHIQSLYDQQLRLGRGPRTVQLIHAVIRNSLNHAVKLWIIDRNPATATHPPKTPHKEMVIYNRAQVQELILTAQLTNSRFAEFLQLAIATGMRMGELLGLQWKDIDWTHQTIHIRRQYNRKGKMDNLFSPPKTKAGIRKIQVGPEVMAILEIQSEKVSRMIWEAAGEWTDHDLVFPSPRGTPLNDRYILTSFKKLAKQAGLPVIRFHDLRHTAASLMLNKGIPVYIVSRRLGHSKASITLDVYGHLISDIDTGAAELMDSIITPIEVKPGAQTAPKLHQEADFGNNGTK